MDNETMLPDLTRLDPLLEQYKGKDRAQLLPLLFKVQAQLGYLPEAAVTAVGKTLRVPLAEIYGVIEFYTMLYKRPTAERIVRICTSPMCAMMGGHAALHAVADHLGIQPGEAQHNGQFMLEDVQCLGLCDHAPAALVGTVPTGPIDGEDVGGWIAAPQEVDLGVIAGDPRWLTARCGRNEAMDLSAYQAEEGYRALEKALKEMNPSEVIEAIKASGLVGRGGAAFPVGLKWEYTAGTEADIRYIVCNADESEPGTFKDRVLMEGDPFSVLEGMTIAGYAVGAKQGYLYVRGEYPRCQRILGEAIEKARSGGYLGRDIMGVGFDFDIELRSGAGAYICGEETALFESIEGKRGYPRLKPPFPTTFGLFGQPTVINNVETLCTAVWIVGHGVEAYRSIGTEGSPGSKLFCLSGDIVKPGVYEVPFGTTIRELIDLGGSVKGELQAVLLGGAAGAFTGPDQLDLPLSFEDLREAGLPLGSGVVTVINHQRDLKSFLLSLALFFAHESCGKCFPCQLGTQRQLELVARLEAGTFRKGDLSALQDVGFAMTHASLCGLGMTASTAILSALERWPELAG
jgi:NADH-quinone oxidoreductase subunit F